SPTIAVFAYIGRLETLEIWQDILVTPAGATHLRPAIIVILLAAIVDHAIYGAGAAKHLAGGQIKTASGRVGAGLCMPAPVHCRIIDHISDARRYPRVRV